MSNQPKSNRLNLKTCDGFIFPDRSEIIRFEAGHNFVLVFIVGNDGPIKMPSTLSSIELQYPFPEFFRCHKSHIVNLTHIIKYEKKCRTIHTPSGNIALAEDKVDEFNQKMGLD
jgi:two-component system LytT family response regulator